MTIVDALKAKGATGSTIAEAVTTLPAVTPSSLPEVTASDNGDVLTVVEGAWAKATPSGGGIQMATVGEGGVLDKSFNDLVGSVCFLDMEKTIAYPYRYESLPQREEYSYAFITYDTEEGWIVLHFFATSPTEHMTMVEG